MKPKPNQHIDKLLGELGLPPQAVDPEELSDKLFPMFPPTPTPTTSVCGKTCYPSETSARKCANRIKKRGANTSFLRPYFCQTCKSWHITSGKSHIAGNSTLPKRHAGHKRRNHQPTPYDHES